MTNGDIRKVQYAHQQQTLKTISEETGIPASSLSYISRGLRDVPRQYKTTLANYYKREAYDRLRENGLSSVQANRFKWYAPEKVLDVENTMRETLMRLSMGVMSSKLKGFTGKLTFEAHEKLFQESYAAVKKGVQKTRKNLEDIEKY